VRGGCLHGSYMSTRCHRFPLVSALCDATRSLGARATVRRWLAVFKDPTVMAVGKKHGVSAAQVALRWLVQQNITIVTAADELGYIKEDIDLFSFSLSPQEMRTLAAL
jgi:diketogulonate reductase-like aldo/keto reductase